MLKKNLNDNLYNFFSLLTPYKIGFFVYFFLSILGVLFGIFIKNIMRYLTNDLTSLKSYDNVGRLLIILCLIISFHELLIVCKGYYQNMFLVYIKKYLNDILLERILKYKDSYFSKYSNTIIITGLKNIIDGTDELSFYLRKITNCVVDFLGNIILIFAIDYRFLIIILTWISIWQFFIRYFSNKSFYLYENVCQDKYAVNLNLGDVFNNTTTIKTFNTIEYEHNRNKNFSSRLLNSEYEISWSTFKMNIIGCLLFILFFSINIYVSYKLLIARQLYAGDITIIIWTVKDLYQRIDEFADYLTESTKMLGQINEGMEVIYQPINENDDSKEKLVVKKSTLTIRNLFFKYNGDHCFHIEKEINIEEGSTVAVVGVSGCGKTTFFKILLGLLEADSGEIIMDGCNILNYNLESRMSMFALIPQEISLFHRSILDNLKYGSFDVDIKEVEAIMNKTNLFDLVNSMKYGYDTIIGDANCLSGGQKQRLVIARGLLKRAKIFLFDESTSALDSKTEKDIMNTINEMTRGYTKLIIAHKLNTVRDADMILVFDEGKIIEKGTHSELIEMQGVYKNLIDLM